jgi:multiple sugar transport system substrate-binding protein
LVLRFSKSRFMIKGDYALAKKLVPAIRLAAAATAAALLLAGCAGTPSEPAASDEPVTLRLVWWGNDVRAAATEDAVAAFEEKYPNITVETEALPYDGYHDKLSTQIAANDAPDVQQLQGEFMAQYGNQGALLPLTDVDTTNLDPGTLKNGFIDGEQIAVPTGLSTLVVVANPALFDQAGVEMPDDTTWTWEDFDKIASQITAGANTQGVYGAKSLGWDITEMATWVAQRGSELFTEDGELGAKTDDFASLFELAKKMMDDGGSPSASESSEQLTLAPEQSGVATGRYAMQLDAVSNFPALSTAFGGDLKILRLPSESGKKGDAKMMFVASQYWGASARTAHPVESQLLIDYLANDVEAGKILGITRGTPANSEIRDAILPQLPETDKTVVDFLSEVSGEVVPSRLAPAGAASFTKNMQRYASEVLFGRQSPEDAAKNLIAETEAALQ